MNRPAPLHDQVLAVLRDHGPSTARFVAAKLFRCDERFVDARHLGCTNGALRSLRRSGLAAAVGKSLSDRRVNLYALTDRARALSQPVAGMPALVVDDRR